MAEIKMPTTDNQPDNTAKPSTKQLAPVTQATFKKPSAGKRALNNIIKADAEGVKTYLLTEGVSAVFECLMDGLKGALDIFIYGERRSGSYRGTTKPKITYVDDNQKTRYGSMYGSSRSSSYTHSMYDIDEVYVQSSEIFAMIAEQMGDYIREYGQVPVRVFYDLLGKSSDRSCEDWGWDDMSGFRVVSCPPTQENGGNPFRIIVPRARPLSKRAFNR